MAKDHRQWYWKTIPAYDIRMADAHSDDFDEDFIAFWWADLNLLDTKRTANRT